MAERTRSRLSRTVASGSPTIVKWGSPNETSTSIWTGYASTPKTAALRRLASTWEPMQDGAPTVDCRNDGTFRPRELACAAKYVETARVRHAGRFRKYNSD
jgi:hypothetical protein